MAAGAQVLRLLILAIAAIFRPLITDHYGQPVA
jgi:hypothetical protein